MAEENNQEENKKSPVKLILMIVGGVVLLGVGAILGVFLAGGEETDPSSEISHSTILIWFLTKKSFLLLPILLKEISTNDPGLTFISFLNDLIVDTISIIFSTFA